MTVRRAVLPFMALLLALYVAAHSPVLGWLGRGMGLHVGRCYFTCGGWIAGGDLASMAAAWALLLAAAGVAWLQAARLGLASFELPLGFGLLWLGFVALPSAALGAAGWALGVPLLRPPAGPLLAAVPALIALLAGRSHWRALPRPRVRAPRGLAGLLALVAVALLGTTVAITLSHPPTGYDALSYHGPLAVYLWRDGDLGAWLERTPWAWALAHPGTAELWFGLLRLAAGERVASLGQLPFALLGSAAVYAFAMRLGVGRGGARVGGAAFLLAPIVVLQSGSQVNDLAAGALLMTAIALAAAPVAGWSGPRLAVVGLALGLAVTTKLAALPAVVAVAGYVIVASWRSRRLPVLVPGVMAGLLAVGPWWARNLALYGNPIYPAALPLLGRGYVVGDFVRKDAWFVPTPLAWPLYPWFEPHNDMSGFGAVFAVAALVGLGVALAHPRRRAPLLLYGVAVLVALPAWWLLTQHEPRLLLGLFGLGFAFTGRAIAAVPQRRRRAAVLVVGTAAVFSALVTLDQALRPLARQPVDRAEFYDRVWNVDSVTAGLPEREGLLSHTGFARLSYASDYPLLGRRLGRLLYVVDGEMPADSIVAIMRRAGVRYAYLPAGAEAADLVARMYPGDRFELVRRTTGSGEKLGDVGRYLFRLRSPSDHPASSTTPRPSAPATPSATQARAR
jgi:hypothetical protein